MLRHFIGERPDGRSQFLSGTERLMSTYLRAAGLGDCVPNYHVIDANGDDRYIDDAWPDQQVGLELNTFRWHTGKSAVAADAHRSNALTEVGWRIVVATDDDFDDRLRRPIASLRTLLDR